MSVIVELTLPADEFELGRILAVEGDTSISLETMVPLGGRSVPFLRLRTTDRRSFEERVREHPAVDDIQLVSSRDGDTLYALDWQVSEDAFFEGVTRMDAHLLAATGTARIWEFELRFQSHETLSSFHEYCIDADLPIEIGRVYNPTKPEAGPWYGLTAPQRETLTRAVEAGYYSIPRQISTAELADKFSVSDQAVTERLRRAVITLVTNTLLVSEQEG